MDELPLTPAAAARPFARDELQPLAVAVPTSVTMAATPAAVETHEQDADNDDGTDDKDESSDSGHKRRKRHRSKHLRTSPESKARRLVIDPSDPDWDPSCCGLLWRMLGIIGLIFVIAAVLMTYKESVAAPHGLRGPPAPLWLTTHDTRSAPLDVHSAMARSLVAYLDEALGTLLNPLHYPCLCMHHVNAGAVSNQLYQVCSTTQIAGPLVNPTLVGRGNETDYWSESSAACQTLERGQRRARYRTIWLHWHDVPTGQQMFGRFDGAVAACLQLAMDEMTLGNKVCSE